MQDKKTIVTFGQLILPLTLIIALGLLFFSVKLFFYTPVNPEPDDIMQEESKQIEQIIKDKKAEKTLSSNNANMSEKTVEKNASAQVEKQKSNDVEEHVSIISAKPIVVDKKTDEGAVLKVGKVAAVDTATETQDKKRVAEKNENANQIKSNKVKDKSDTVKTKGQPEKESAKIKAEKGTAKKTLENGIETKTHSKNTAKETATKTDGTKSKPGTVSVGKRWDIQIGGFSDKKNAEQLMQKAQKEGHKVYIIEGNMNNSPYYRIRVKGNANKTKAEKLYKELGAKGYPVYLIAVEQTKIKR